jgi:tRNA(Ile)-lysidine synthase
MFEAFREQLTRKNWGAPQHRLLVAVSGGLDSMALLHLLHQAGCSLGAGHVNFQLRGAAADEDEQFVREVCGRLRLTFHARRVDTNNYAMDKGVSVQVAARELRYRWLSEVARAEGYTHIATGHHADDNMETVLLNWIHGKGWDGWLGMPAQNGLIIRPLLGFSREQLLSYAAAMGITWREDESNQSDEYQRNALRHHVLPELRKINPALTDTFQIGLTKTEAVPYLIAKGLEYAGAEGIQSEGHDMRIENKWLLEHAGSVGLLFEILRPLGFTLSQTQQLVGALNHVGAQFSSATHLAVVDRGAILVGPAPSAPSEITIGAGVAQAHLGAQRLQLSVQPPAIDTNASVGCFDLETISFPLTWRTWRPGDVLQPLGMAGTRKVSDMLIDAKIPRLHKAGITVLESGGRVAWLVGHRVAEWARVTATTRQMLRVERTWERAE